VISIRERNDGPFPITLITLFELPYQKYLEKRRMTTTQLIWADTEMQSEYNQKLIKEIEKEKEFPVLSCPASVE
jgi:hypothetical protein